MWWRVEGGFGVDHLVLSEHVAVAPGPGQVRVELRAWALNYRDVLMVAGKYDPRLPLPFVPLSDAVGVVTATGDGVARVAVGDRVCPTFSPRWIAGAPDADAVRFTRGGVVPGVAAREVTLGEAELVRVPARLSDVAAACLPCAGLTAWTAVVEHGQVRPGHTVLVIGSGGVSSFAIAFARAAGARVFAIGSSPEKADRLRALGVEHVVDRADPKWGRAIRAASDGGVDLVVEVGGAGTWGQSLDAVRVGGTVAVIGNLAGSVEPVSVLPILMKQVRCQGVFVGSRRSFEAMNDALARSEIAVPIGATYPFESLPDALAAQAVGAFGKICLTA